MAFRPPAWRVVGDKAQLYGGAAAAGAEKRRRPRQGVLADEIDVSGLKDVGQVLDDIGSKPRAESGAARSGATIVGSAVSCGLLGQAEFGPVK